MPSAAAPRGPRRRWAPAADCALVLRFPQDWLRGGAAPRGSRYRRLPSPTFQASLGHARPAAHASSARFAAVIGLSHAAHRVGTKSSRASSLASRVATLTMPRGFWPPQTSRDGAVDAKAAIAPLLFIAFSGCPARQVSEHATSRFPKHWLVDGISPMQAPATRKLSSMPDI